MSTPKPQPTPARVLHIDPSDLPAMTVHSRPEQPVELPSNNKLREMLESTAVFDMVLFFADGIYSVLGTKDKVTITAQVFDEKSTKLPEGAPAERGHAGSIYEVAREQGSRELKNAPAPGNTGRKRPGIAVLSSSDAFRYLIRARRQDGKLPIGDGFAYSVLGKTAPTVTVTATGDWKQVDSSKSA